MDIEAFLIGLGIVLGFTIVLSSKVKSPFQIRRENQSVLANRGFKKVPTEKSLSREMIPLCAIFRSIEEVTCFSKEDLFFESVMLKVEGSDGNGNRVIMDREEGFFIFPHSMTEFHLKNSFALNDRESSAVVEQGGLDKLPLSDEVRTLLKDPYSIWWANVLSKNGRVYIHRASQCSVAEFTVKCLTLHSVMSSA